MAQDLANSQWFVLLYFSFSRLLATDYQWSDLHIPKTGIAFFHREIKAVAFMVPVPVGQRAAAGDFDIHHVVAANEVEMDGAGRPIQIVGFWSGQMARGAIGHGAKLGNLFGKVTRQLAAFFLGASATQA